MFGTEKEHFIGRVLDFSLMGCRFESHRRHCIVSLSKTLNPLLIVMVQNRKHPGITEKIADLDVKHQLEQI